MNEFYLITGMACVTFLIRYIMLPLSGKFEFPPLLNKALKFVPPAVLTAIIVPSVLMPTGNKIMFSLDNAYLVGGLAAFFVGLVTKNLLLVIIISMAIFLGWQFFMY